MTGLRMNTKVVFFTVRSTEVLLGKSNESGSYQSFYLFLCFSGQSVFLCKTALLHSVELQYEREICKLRIIQLHSFARL